MMEVDREVQQSAGLEYAHGLRDDPGWPFGVVNYVIAEHYVERAISEGKALAEGRNSLYPTLPNRKQGGVVTRERIDTHTEGGVEVKDQTMGAASHFECAKLRRQRTQSFKAQAHACRAGAHGLDVLPLVAYNSLCLLPLVSELTLESALRLYGLCRLTPSALSSH
jgi:hypothetical protein